MLPYLKDRPLTMHRFPDGISKEDFCHKNASHYFPNWIKTEKIKKEGGWPPTDSCGTASERVESANWEMDRTGYSVPKNWTRRKYWRRSLRIDLCHVNAILPSGINIHTK